MSIKRDAISVVEEIEQMKKRGEVVDLSEFFETNEYGAYKFPQKYPDTPGLKVYKSTKMKPTDKMIWFLNQLGVEKASEPGWLKMYYNNTLIFMHERELYMIIGLLANQITPYYWGPFGVGKTFKANRIFKKLFGRVHSIRMFKNTSQEELFGSVDVLNVYTISNILKDILISYDINELAIQNIMMEAGRVTETVEKLAKEQGLGEKETEMLKNKILQHNINRILGKYLTPKDILKISQQLNDKLRIIRLSNFYFAEIGKALEENSSLLIDEIDKVSDKDLNLISQPVQSRDRAIQITGFGTFEFNQPIILLGNKENISRFISSRVKSIQAMVLPESLLEELLKSEGITDPEVLRSLIKLAPKLETGEISIRELVNNGLVAQQIKELKTSAQLPISIDINDVLSD